MGTTIGGPSVPPPTSDTGSVGGSQSTPPSQGTDSTQGTQGNQQTQGSQQPSKPEGSETSPRGQQDTPPPPSSTGTDGLLPSNAFDSTTAAQADLGNMILSDSMTQTRDADKQSNTQQSEHDRPIDREQARSNAADKVFMMKSEDMQATQQRMFQSLMSSQQKTESWIEKRQVVQQQVQDPKAGEGTDDPSLKQQFLRVRSQVSPGLTKEMGDGRQMLFKNQMPAGYNAFMQPSPRGRQLFIYSDRPLKGEGMEGKEGEADQTKANAKATKETGKGQMSQGLLAAQKKLAKQMGLKEGTEETDELEEALAMNEEEGGAEGVEEDSNDPMAALRKAMGAKASKAKGKGEGDEEVGDDLPWQNFGEAIEHHTVLFASADNAESAQLVAQANFAGAIIMGAAIHIKLRGAKLNYSGTSHHGLPIPSGDEALDIGRDQVVAGFERDMGQLGVESVFVNGQRFELANPDDERKLKALVQDNPELYQMIEDIREAIRESRFYRTCKGLMEEGPGGRA
jgi:hypothetical protein